VDYSYIYNILIQMVTRVIKPSTMSSAIGDHFISLANPEPWVSQTTVVITGLLLMLTTCLVWFNQTVRSLTLFCWACFFKPFAKNDHGNSHQSALESFYRSQASIYDSSRGVLLKGREKALQLAASHLKKSSKLVWIDVGGGTGYNVEIMNSLLPITSKFEKVIVVDLSISLCEVAKQRFEKLGFNNVEVLVADACDFLVPEKYMGNVDLITFSYSLSMIPPFHAAVDHILPMLNKEIGIICSVDFGVQTSATSIGRTNTLGGSVNRHVPWVFRTFWRAWFELDRVFLDPARRDYLEYKFGTIKSLNCSNRLLGNIPYYIWIGCDKDRSSLLLHRLNAMATESPYLAPASSVPVKSKGYERALENNKKHLPYPSIYYQREVWRVYYEESNPQYAQFNDQYIYAFTWEDPREDIKILNLKPSDVVLAITSAGDNLLSYASIEKPPRRIHGVDLNPAQNHLCELKLASLRCLKYEEVWKLFGLGKVENFEELLFSKLAPQLSSNSFQYWAKHGPQIFDIKGKGLYDTGFTRWALRLAKYVFKIAGVSDTIEELLTCKSMEEQKFLWESKIKPAIFNPIVSKMLVGNPIFLWKALGVPPNQAKMMNSSILTYVVDTLDPIVGRSLISKDNYFYYLTLRGRYSPTNCPDYLTKQTFKKMHEKESPLDNIRLHTDTLNDVFERLASGSLTVAIIMDHMDWFDPKKNEAQSEVEHLKKCLCNGGRVLLRSISKEPWYIKVFEENGFHCQAAAVRVKRMTIDRTNMYASAWVCTKIPARRVSDLTI